MLTLVDVDIGIFMYVVTGVGINISADASADVAAFVDRLVLDDSTDEIGNGVVGSSVALDIKS